MASGKTRYLAHARSRRFLLAAAGAGALLVALVVEGWVAWLAAVAAAGALLALLLVVSIRLSDLTREVSQLAGDMNQISARLERGVQQFDEEESPDRLIQAMFTLEEASLREAGYGYDAFGQPRVTVVIPCYNEERFVAEAIESIRRQSLEDWECIVVDDASTDRSVQVIWKAVSEDPRFRVLRHRVNGGLGAARNTGLRAARGRFITFLDSDDLLMRDSLAERVIALSQAMGDPHVIGSYCGVHTALEDVSLDELLPRRGPNRGGIVDFVSANAECPFNAHAPLLIAEKLRQIGGFKESMRHGAEDWDLWYRVLRNGYVFVPAKSITAIYRQKLSSMVRTLPDAHVAEADRLISAAFRAADPAILTAPSPTPLTKPISNYMELLRKAERALRFAAMALVLGDVEAARRTLETHRDLPANLLQRHLDMRGLVARGMMRALAIKHTELKELDSSAQDMTERLQRLIDETAGKAEVVEKFQAATFKVALIPQHAGQIRNMLAAVDQRLKDRSSVAVINVSREAGDQGAALEIPDQLPCFSLNEWVLGGHRAEAVVVGTVRVAAADQLAGHLVSDGAELIEVAQSHAEAMSLEEAHRPTTNPGKPVVSLLGRHLSTEPLTSDPAETWAIEEYPDTKADTLDVADFRDRHKGERVVIIGNGPSLNECDLTKLKAEFTIAVNGIFYAADRMGFDPSYYVVEDTAVMRDNLDAIKAYEAGHKFFPSIYRQLVGNAPNVTYFMMNRGFYEPKSPDFCIPKFSFNPEQRIYSGQSVTIINLQLAYLMGFTEVVLIGMDFSYTIPDSAQVKGDVITSQGDDPNHFHPDYFGAGKVWKDPKLDRVLANYALAKEVYEADGRRIVNATVGGNLELFKREDYESIFRT